MIFELRPFTPDPKLRGLTCEMHRRESSLLLKYVLSGWDDEVLWPPLRQDPQLDLELWKSTCFEVFFRTPHSNRYEEWNFSPSGSWGYLSFESYRSRDRSKVIKQLSGPIQTQPPFSLEVKVPDPGGKLEIQISAVIETKANPSLSYWALSHPERGPDFHDPKCFQVIDSI